MLIIMDLILYLIEYITEFLLLIPELLTVLSQVIFFFYLSKSRHTLQFYHLCISFISVSIINLVILIYSIISFIQGISHKDIIHFGKHSPLIPTSEKYPTIPFCILIFCSLYGTISPIIIFLFSYYKTQKEYNSIKNSLESIQILFHPKIES